MPEQWLDTEIDKPQELCVTQCHFVAYIFGRFLLKENRNEHIPFHVHAHCYELSLLLAAVDTVCMKINVNIHDYDADDIVVTSTSTSMSTVHFSYKFIWQPIRGVARADE